MVGTVQKALVSVEVKEMVAGMEVVSQSEVGDLVADRTAVKVVGSTTMEEVVEDAADGGDEVERVEYGLKSSIG